MFSEDNYYLPTAEESRNISLAFLKNYNMNKIRWKE